MGEYSFETIRALRRREGVDLERDYRAVIRERADEGWEFVQAIPFLDAAEPRMDLVFRRKGASQ